MNTFLTILAAAGLPTIIAAVIGFRSVKAQLSANQANSSANAALTRSQENAQNITILQGLIQTLQDEVARSQKVAAAAEEAASTARDRAKASEKRLDAIESELQDSQEQNDLMARQLVAANEEIRLLRDQKAILLEHARRVDQWWQEQLLPKIPADLGVTPPPRLTGFDPA